MIPMAPNETFACGAARNVTLNTGYQKGANLVGDQPWGRHFLVYGFGVILMNLLPALMVPIYTHRVSPLEFGVLELLNRSQEILRVVLSLGLASALTTFYQMKKDEPHLQKGIYSTAVQFLLVVGLVVTLVLLAGAGKMSRTLFNTSSYKSAVVLILAATYFEMLFQMAVLNLQSGLRSSLYVTAHVSRLLLAIVLNLVLVYWFRLGLMGVLWATLIHTSVFSIGLLAYMFSRTGRAFHTRLMWEMLRFGLPLLPASAIGFFFNNGDRYFLNAFRSPAEVGFYGLGYKLGMMSMLLVIMPFGKIWSVTMVDISGRSDGPREMGRIATLLLMACTASMLGLSLFGPYLVRIMAPPAYSAASQVIPVVGIAYLFYAWTMVMDASFYVTKRTFYKPIILAISSVAMAALYWGLIPHYGMMGAAWATLGGFAIFSVVTLIFAQRVYYIDYEFGRIGALTAMGIGLYLAGNLISVASLVPGLLGRAAILLLFPTILWIGGFFTDSEKRIMGNYCLGLRLRFQNSVSPT
ncbi:MAG TPA: oligosaccharide flippase family protein [Candidatus Sulfotelmatobacter sp.]|nr:oligosaccharide flippase family protein [Candidatus Sulfotelmatobacter sp.]